MPAYAVWAGQPLQKAVAPIYPFRAAITDALYLIVTQGSAADLYAVIRARFQMEGSGHPQIIVLTLTDGFEGWYQPELWKWLRGVGKLNPAGTPMLRDDEIAAAYRRGVQEANAAANKQIEEIKATHAEEVASLKARLYQATRIRSSPAGSLPGAFHTVRVVPLKPIRSLNEDDILRRSDNADAVLACSTEEDRFRFDALLANEEDTPPLPSVMGWINLRRRRPA